MVLLILYSWTLPFPFLGGMYGSEEMTLKVLFTTALRS